VVLLSAKAASGKQTLSAPVTEALLIGVVLHTSTFQPFQLSALTLDLRIVLIQLIARIFTNE